MRRNSGKLIRIVQGPKRLMFRFHIDNYTTGFDTHMIRLHMRLSRIKLNCGPRWVDTEELSKDSVAVLVILNAETSVAISPQKLISRKRVIDRHIFLDRVLLAIIVDGMWHTNRFRHAFF